MGRLVQQTWVRRASRAHFFFVSYVIFTLRHIASTSPSTAFAPSHPCLQLTVTGIVSSAVSSWQFCAEQTLMRNVPVMLTAPALDGLKCTVR